MNSCFPAPILVFLGTFLVPIHVPVAGATLPACPSITVQCSERQPSLRHVFHQYNVWDGHLEETASVLPPLNERKEVENQWMGYDKLQHLSFSFLTTLSSQYILTEKLHWHHDHQPLIVSTGVTTAIGLGKEYYDSRHGGIFSLRDLAADGLGILLASGLILL